MADINTSMTPAAVASIKLALRITTDAFDREIQSIGEAAIADLYIAGVRGEKAVITDPLFLRAVTTYCKTHFGQPDEYDRLKRSYDEQKAQMMMATGYTIWTRTPEV